MVEGDTTDDGQVIELVPAIEVGNIFKLGTRYTVPLGATYLDEDGKEKPIVMGSYGMGPALGSSPPRRHTVRRRQGQQYATEPKA